MNKPEVISPTVRLVDEYGNERTVTPPGWVWILAFALAGCSWAVKIVESGELDGQLWEGAYI